MIRRTLEATWPGRVDEVAYRGKLDPFPIADISAAVDALADEKQWMPKLSEIRQKIRELHPGDRLERPPARTVCGEQVLARVGVALPWVIDGRTFFADVESLRLTEGRRRGQVRLVVSAFGSWDIPDGMVAWESWDIELITSCKEAV